MYGRKMPKPSPSYPILRTNHAFQKCQGDAETKTLDIAKEINAVPRWSRRVNRTKPKIKKTTQNFAQV